MSLTAFNRFRRMQQVEEMKPENIEKVEEIKEEKPVEIQEEPKKIETIKAKRIAQTKTAARRSKK